MNQITLDEMRALSLLHRFGSISLAADAQEVTASTISRSLTRLEQKLGCSLVMRHTRRLELTDRGLELLTHFEPILESVNQVERRFTGQQQQPHGKLRVNAGSPALMHLIAPVISDYCQRFPLVTVELHNDEAIVDIIERKADVAVRVGHLRDSSLNASYIGSSKRRLLASPDYLRQHGIPQSVEQLQQHRLLGLEGATILNQWPLLTANGERLKVKPQVITSSGEVLRKLALDGAGIACLSDFMTIAERDSGSLLEVLPQHTIEDSRDLHAVYYRGAATPTKISEFISLLKQHFQG